MTCFRSILSRCCRDEDGVTLVEYGIALTVAIAVGGAAISLLADAVDDSIDEATACLNGTPGITANCP